LLVIEVAETSADFDRQIKAPRYARGFESGDRERLAAVEDLHALVGVTRGIARDDHDVAFEVDQPELADPIRRRPCAPSPIGEIESTPASGPRTS
jgi:hypothetical protein